MRQAEKPDHERPTPGDRLSRLGEAVLRINEDLDLNTILQRIVEGACSLTGARYGAILIFDDSGRIQDLITSGITPEELGLMNDQPRGLGLLGYLNEVQEPLRLRDIASHPRSVGFPENHPPMATFLGAPVRHRSENLGNLYLTEKEGGGKFTLGDEETLVIFPSQAAMAVVNATPIFSEEGEVVSVVATIQDMTPLEELERLRAEFLGMVSHELREPLAAIKGSTATLLSTASPFDTAEFR